MTEKLKLPVRVACDCDIDCENDVIVDAAGEYVELQAIASALNATARRCDGCVYWDRDDVEDGRAYCGKHERWHSADDYCRKGWEAR